MGCTNGIDLYDYSQISYVLAVIYCVEFHYTCFLCHVCIKYIIIITGLTSIICNVLCSISLKTTAPSAIFAGVWTFGIFLVVFFSYEKNTNVRPSVQARVQEFARGGPKV